MVEDTSPKETIARPGMAVVCRGLTKRFRAGTGEVHALAGIDLDVLQSSVMMLVGPSGCGKTTLISVIAGILHRDGGICHVFDTDVETLRPVARLDFRARNVGFILQQFHLLPTLSIVDNVAIPLLIKGASRVVAQRAAASLLDQVGLGDRCAELPVVLSGGEQQRVAIARALVHKPRLVVCDEPTSALDHDTGQRVMQLMRRLVHETGATLLIVTHDERIFSFADRIAHMDDGRIVGLEDPPPHPMRSWDLVSP
jgi:putative ABC transport system ATP-binding protein